MGSQLPIRLRIQFAFTRRLTALLGRFGLREQVILARGAALRGRRELFERFGSPRYSRPALHQMDRKLDRILDRDGGFYVEAGGFDGFTQSNTYYLERFRGWHGLLVEPMPELAAEARRNRPGARVLQCALVSSEHEGACVEMEFGDLMSTVSGTHDADWTDAGLTLGWRDHRTESVPAASLSRLLDEAGDPHVDLLSLDVEGYEAAVLRGLELDRHAPDWILVEMHDLAAGRREIGPLLGARYIEHAQLSPLDVLYRRLDTDREPH